MDEDVEDIAVQRRLISEAVRLQEGFGFGECLFGGEGHYRQQQAYPPLVALGQRRERLVCPPVRQRQVRDALTSRGGTDNHERRGISSHQCTQTVWWLVAPARAPACDRQAGRLLFGVEQRQHAAAIEPMRGPIGERVVKGHTGSLQCRAIGRRNRLKVGLQRNGGSVCPLLPRGRRGWPPTRSTAAMASKHTRVVAEECAW